MDQSARSKFVALLPYIIAVVIILAGLGLLWHLELHKQKVSETAPVPSVVAPKGTLVSGFPIQFIPAGVTVVSSSHYLSGSTVLNRDIYTAQYTSTTSISVLYNYYALVMHASGYVLTKATSNVDPWSFDGNNSNSYMGVSAKNLLPGTRSTASTTIVSISYIKKI